MKNAFRLAAALMVSTGLASCHGIGGGSTVQSIKIIYFPVTGEDHGALLTATNDPGAVTTDTVKMYGCFCSTVKVYAYFTDGTIGDFTTRATLTSDNPGIVKVTKFDTTQPCGFFQNDPLLWSLVPSGTPGTATLTAQFLSLKATLAVRVDGMDGTNGAGGPNDPPITFMLTPSDDLTNTGPVNVAVGATRVLQLRGTIDNTERILNDDVGIHWAITPDETKAAITKFALAGGILTGISHTGTSGDPSPTVTAAASFGACPLLPPITTQVKVGDIVPPLALDYEPNFDTDQLLATSSDEQLAVHAPLDFDGDAVEDTSSADRPPVTNQIRLDYTDTCTLRSYLAGGDGTSTLTDCAEASSNSCAATTPVCFTGMTACSSGTVTCRTAVSPVIPTLIAGRVLATGDSGGNPTNFTALFPAALGTATTLSANVADGATTGATTTITVSALTGYPLTVPWFGVIDAANSPEDVQVTAVSGTTLTVNRAQGGTVANAHLAGVSFTQRPQSTSNALPVTGKPGTLTSLAIDPPGTLAALGTVQLQAQGTFVDSTSASRQQQVTRLTSFATGSPTLFWFSSDPTVATVVANTGLVSSIKACGGTVVIRARASTSTNTVDSAFAKPAAIGDATDQDSNNNTDANDTACTTTDDLCDQVTFTVAAQNPLPEGTTCP